MIKQVDFMRAFAALCIVMIHVTSGQVLTNDYAYLTNQLSRFASPMFLLLAGMVLVHIELKRPSPSLAYFYKRRFSRVLIPYLLWSLFYFLFNARHLILDFQWASLWDSLLHLFPMQLLQGSAFVHLYFILIMVQFYALFPLLYRWLQVHTSSFILVSILLTAGLNGLVYMHQLRWLVLPSLPIPYVVIFINWIAYFAIGMAVMYYEQRWKEVVLKRSMLILTVCMWILSLALLLYDGMKTNTYAISVKPSSMLYGMVSFILIYIIVYITPLPKGAWKEKGSRVVEWLARNSFLIYLLHPFCLNVLVKLSVFFQIESIFYRSKGLALLFLLTVLTTCLGIYLIHWTPFSRILGGPRRTKQTVNTLPAAKGGMNV